MSKLVGYEAAMKLVERITQDGCRIQVVSDDVVDLNWTTDIMEVMEALTAVDECYMKFTNAFVLDAPIRVGVFHVIWDNEPHPFADSSTSAYVDILWKEVLDPFWRTLLN